MLAGCTEELHHFWHSPFLTVCFPFLCLNQGDRENGIFLWSVFALVYWINMPVT